MNKFYNALEEWKERYESYRQYFRLYFTTLSIVVTGWLVGFAFAMSGDTPHFGRLIILGVLSLMFLVLLIAHVIARQAVSALGQRLQKLEMTLKFDEFYTTRPLESALNVTLSFTILGLVITVAILTLAWSNRI